MIVPHIRSIALFAIAIAAAGVASAQQAYQPPRCEIVPLPDHQVAFQIDGVEKLRWHYGSKYPRPFFYPLNGPSGVSLTRMGHPGAPNHDHHRSVWFGHHSVGGSDFWSEHTKAQVRQKTWYAYADGDTEAIMASAIGWYDAEGREVMEQELVAALLPLEHGEHALELQITFRPPANGPAVELAKTNFGFLAVRVAKSISVHFGGGTLTSSEGHEGEAAIFGEQARWVDYSGPLAVGGSARRSSGDPSNPPPAAALRRVVTEGITYFDHPANPHYPTHWHVRADGWMGASFDMHQPHTIGPDQPLVLRYLLHAHGGAYDAAKAAAVHEAFAMRPGFVVAKSKRSHRQFEVYRAAH